MSLDLSKLKNVHRDGEKTIAECPACAAEGHDSTGDHLVIWPDGRFGCVVHKGDGEHRKEIFRLAGQKTVRMGPVPIRIRRPTCATVKPKTLMVLDWLVVDVLSREGSSVESSPRVAAGDALEVGDEPVTCCAESGQTDRTGNTQNGTAAKTRHPFGCKVPSL
jgi:hypothetical protein